MHVTNYEYALPPTEETLERFLHDSTIIKIVTVLDISSLSTLELMEYGLTKQDIRYSYVNGIIEFDLAALLCCPTPSLIEEIVHSYYDFWNSRKFRLTRLGLYILDCLKQQYEAEPQPVTTSPWPVASNRS